MKQKSDFRRLHEQEGCFLIPIRGMRVRRVFWLLWGILRWRQQARGWRLPWVSAMGGCHKKPHWRIAVIW